MNKTIRLLIVLLVIVTMCVVLLPFVEFGQNTSFDDLIVSEKIVQIDYNETKSKWKEYKKINEDYVGQIVFDSGLIDKPFVQAKSCFKSDGEPYSFFNQDGSRVTSFDDYNGNDVYIWMDFETMEYDYDKKGGSIFLDYRNNLDDQNLIIYGHYFSTIYNKDPERIKAFTPLEKLLEPSYYENNSTVKLFLENEIRIYKLWAVYKYNSNESEYFDRCQYYRPNYNIDDYTGIIDENYYRNYIDFVNGVKLYDTGIDLTTADKTLTLQTCMTPYNYLYEICVFKQIDSESY